MKKKLNSRERKMIIGAGVFLGVIGIYILFLEPFLKKKSELDEEVSRSYRQYGEYMALLSNQAVYQEQLQARRREMLTVSRLLLSGNTSSLAAAELSNKIRSFANEAGLSITRENVKPAVEIDHHQEISIELNMSGDIAGLQEFLERIERDTNLLVIQSLDVSAPTSMRRSFRKGAAARNQPESESFRVTMAIAGYIESEEAPAGGKR